MTSPSDQPTHQELADDLKAAIAARRELGKDMEDPVLESFLDRVEEHIQSRVDQQLAQAGTTRPTSSSQSRHPRFEPAVVVVGSLSLAIPLIGAAGPHDAVPIMIAVIIINALYFRFRRG